MDSEQHDTYFTLGERGINELKNSQGCTAHSQEHNGAILVVPPSLQDTPSHKAHIRVNQHKCSIGKSWIQIVRVLPTRFTSNFPPKSNFVGDPSERRLRLDRDSVGELCLGFCLRFCLCFCLGLALRPGRSVWTLLFHRELLDTF